MSAFRTMPVPFLNRELSWLEFNRRVLNEARRGELPLLERLKFLAITASNLDEFFQVRVGGLMLLERGGHDAPDASGLSPAECLAAIRERAAAMFREQYKLFNEELNPSLAEKGVLLLSVAELNPARAAEAARRCDEEVLPLLTPLAVGGDGPPPDIPALLIVVACELEDNETGDRRHVIIPLPGSMGRRVAVSRDDAAHAFVLLEDLVASRAGALFPGEKVTASTAFRLTRNADIAVRDDDAIELAGEMEDVLAARRFAETVRLELRADAPPSLAGMIRTLAGATERQIYECDGPPGLAGFMELAFLPGFDSLRVEEWPPQRSPEVPPGAGMFETISRGDVLLHHPYESFEPVLRLLEEAAVDPDVIVIKQILYRTARDSRIIAALIRAAENGKHVTALVEVKARFDEERNLLRADELRRAGAQIVYGVKNLKTHAKLCLIARREAGRLRRYVHLGTGNYNESTARLYTDVSYLTCKPDFGHDASLLFNAVTGLSKLLRFKRLIPAPVAMKPALLGHIAAEAERAANGQAAAITAKVNSLQDPEIIRALYAASRAGVEIRLNVRGVCCLKPGDPEHSANITVVSIIDRFLEHARIIHFHNGGAPLLFIASADWMTRNLDRRIELMIPIEEPAHKRRLLHVLETFFKDNSQAALILPDGGSKPVPRRKGDKPFRAQQSLYRAARRAAKAREHELAMNFEPFTPLE